MSNVRSLRHQFGDRIALVERLGPKRFVVPNIFTDGDAQILAAKGEYVLGCGRLKIS